MAAFAMGLIGDAAAAPALTAALADADPLIQGRAAEALGLIAHKPAAPAIGAMIAAHVNAGALNGITPTTWAIRRRRPSKRCALACTRSCGSGPTMPGRRLARCQRPAAQPLVADRLCVSADERSARGPGAARAVQGEGQLTRSFAARGLGRIEGSRRGPRCWRSPRTPASRLAVRVQAVRGVALLGDATPRRLDAPADCVAERRPEPAARSGDRACRS